MSVVDLIRRSHSEGISHVDALAVLVKLSKVVSVASQLYAHSVQDLAGRSAEELAILEQLADCLKSLGEDA